MPNVLPSCGWRSRNKRASLTAFACAAAVLLPCAMRAQTAPKSSAPAAAAKTQRFDPHDLSGVWDHSGAVPSDPAPAMTPWGQEKFNLTKPSFGPRAVPPVFGNDPVGKCDPQGFPRISVLENPQPLEFIQTKDRLFEFIEWNHIWRTIWIDGRELPKDHDPMWLGYSVGKWEGDTLVVDTVAMDDRTWLDHLGHVHSEDMRVRERYHRLDRNTLEFTMTIEDPKTYVQPWVIIKPVRLTLNPTHELDEIICAPSDEEIFNDTIRNPAGGVTAPKQ